MDHLQRHVMRLFRSYRHWLGQDLLPFHLDDSLVQRVWEAPLVLLSHGTESDPVLNYGNRQALKLWELDWDRFIQTPSRLTAEPMERTERSKFLEQVTRNGYVDNYSGIRISSTGKKFRIENAIVWNVLDEAQNYIGQAATFKDWRFL